MKCPKCSYLGFETGDRCKNCGYDFSLIDLSPPADEVELDLNLDLNLKTPDPHPAPASAPAPTSPASALPLFAPAVHAADPDLDDEPLIKLPATPRPPLAVRKTPEIPRLRAVPRPAARAAAEPVLQFVEAPIEEPPASVTPEPEEIARPARRAAAAPVFTEPGAPGARLAAAAIDHLILGAIDLAVVYLTLRMAALDMSAWALLPLAPLATFLILLKVAYFCAFTAIGGQTIGKMAMSIRVVTDEGGPVDAACAIRRTLAGTVSTAVLGLGFVPALIGSERRAVHDHLAGTRVVDLHAA